MISGSWNTPVGSQFIVRYHNENGQDLSATEIVRVSTEYFVQVETLCGTETMALTVQAREECTAARLARQSQIAASIMHVTRRACQTCKILYREGLTAAEKQWLHSSCPHEGKVMGLGGNIPL